MPTHTNTNTNINTNLSEVEKICVFIGDTEYVATTTDTTASKDWTFTEGSFSLFDVQMFKIEFTTIPKPWIARIADSRPGPGPLTNMSTS